MMRQSSSRIHRNRGWKVKHVLQICILAVVCVWLIYQVKHSHERKASSEDTLSKSLNNAEVSKIENLKLGRKDPQEKTETAKEIEEVEEKIDETGDDTDETDRDRSEAEEEERESEDKESGLQEIEDADEKSQEAREENYKADDASSAVSKETEEEAQESTEQQQAKGQDAPEDAGIASQMDPMTEEEHHDGRLDIGPLPNSTAEIVSPVSTTNQNTTSPSEISDPLKLVTSNSTENKPDTETLSGNATISFSSNQTDFEHPVASEHVNQSEPMNSTVSDTGKLINIVDSAVQVDNSTQVSMVNRTESTEPQKSDNVVVNNSVPVIDEKESSKVEDFNEYDALHHQTEKPSSSNNTEDKDQGALTKGRAEE